MKDRKLVIKGAREHNLKNISLEIPRDQFVVITGLSGSGKSSLAFDTIYAEGQRRYVESLSAYARQFLGLMEKPDVDLIDGLSPAISIEQKTTHRNPRSTVGTVTEIYDYFRLLYARIGIPYCHCCGKKITSQSVDQIVDSLLTMKKGTKLQILAPLIRGKKGEHVDRIEHAKKNGFVRLRVDGNFFTVDDKIPLEKNKKHTIEIVVDRLVLKDGIRPRLTDSIETSIDMGEGLVVVLADDEEQLYSTQLSCPDCGISIPELSPRMFSFNTPYGACPECDGLGFIMQFDPERIVSDPEKSLKEGVLEVWGKSTSYWYLETVEALAKSLNFDPDTPWVHLPDNIKDVILYGTNGGRVNYNIKRKDSEFKFSRKFEGVLPNLERRYRETNSEEMRVWMEKYMSNNTCTACNGMRLRPESRSVKVADKTINELTSLSIKDLHLFFSGIQLNSTEMKIAEQVLKEIRSRLKFLNDVGIEYLTLDRAAGTLSGGESQRIRLATQLGSSLTGVLYILDEPSIGLHQRDNDRLLKTLKHLRDIGNTVIVVEHDEDTIMNADYVVDLGPGAGVNGGYIVATGTPREVIASEKSLTGKYLSGKLQINLPEERRKPEKFITVKGARENNLKNLDINFPLGVFTAVTGVSGSGKSSLVIEILYKALSSLVMRSKEYPGKFDEITGTEAIDKVIDIDQSPIGRTPRSNPATYTGLFTPVRELFARLPESKVRGYKAGRFSFNVAGGRCEACEGDGVKKIEMHFLPDVYITCDVCKGKRYNHETLEVRYKGKNIFEILDMTVDEAVPFFENINTVNTKLETLKRVGLGYVKLGQPATTLSGGEAQRIKLATELSKRATGKTLYILDEPTTGLHFDDIKKLIEVLNSLVEKGNTVIVIEHNLDVIKTADWIIDLGPEGGDAGGTLVGEGTPENIVKITSSHTGQFLAKILKKKNK
ncbi:MAG TPA: excinuclease ABC subunit UvrA [Spirochaetota bacterium]|nr:excinuclease ABC subunit UvrA [Spirochaetota bacterium]HPF06868.1 excinuclease ABC subunit UvrA [Spirochaetota bacterium]HPJ43451.1 excinuclease ABC subunit UvrA [Spirochaetota bacterium]HPR36141.1 excinuclease ABC subunit UvrA [Spirochaetota bacterium]HRX47813.1 excinuclease ABC subunit UvrA [Spirochaetota bacterium]